MANSQNSKQAIPPKHAVSRSPSPDLPALLDRLTGLLAAATHDAPMMLYLQDTGARQYVLHQAHGLGAAHTAEPCEDASSHDTAAPSGDPDNAAFWYDSVLRQLETQIAEARNSLTRLAGISETPPSGPSDLS